MIKKYEVIVDMHPKYTSTLLRLSLIGMMTKVINVKRIKLTPKDTMQRKEK